MIALSLNSLNSLNSLMTAPLLPLRTLLPLGALARMRNACSLLFLFLLSYRPAEVADKLADREVLAVRVYQRLGLV